MKRELANELMDLIESEFFAGALYELLSATFKSVFTGFLASKLLTYLRSGSLGNQFKVPGDDSPSK